jgi:hypothetical protein
MNSTRKESTGQKRQSSGGKSRLNQRRRPRLPLENCSDLELLRVFPTRAKQVIAMLKRENKKTRRLEEWREKQAVQFLEALILTTAGD